MSRFASRSAVLVGALSLVPATAHAQGGSLASATAVGVTVQAIGTSDGWAEVPAIGLHLTTVRASGLGIDVTLGTVPSVLASGVLLLAPDVGVAQLFPIAGGALMLKAGPSGIIVSGGDETAGVVGVHVGAVAFLRMGPRIGIRAEIVPRFYSFDGESVHLTTFGIGLTSLPERFR
jgi:hypothetical protein